MNNGKGSVYLKERDMATFSKYLVMYNTVQTLGWSYILFQTLKHIIKYQTVTGLWKTCGTSVLLFQTLASLEVLHCLLGLVKANAVTTFVQVASRVVQVWGIMMPIYEVQNSVSLAVALLAWGITEVVRYSFYCAQLLGKPSKFLTWCRYSLFFVLYPAGVYGEVKNIFLALPVIRAMQLFSLTLPNAMNISFSYYYLNILILLSYIPFFPHLFYHMLRQRSKVLGKKDAKSAE